MTDEQAMQLALAQARLAGSAGEVPVGAVLLHQGRVIGQGHNAPIGQSDPSAHAEVLALRAAAALVGNYRLDDCELFVTLEPCAMCAGAIMQARVRRLVFGAADPKCGAAGSVVDLFANTRLNHHTSVQGGVLAADCADLLSNFFQCRRRQKSLAALPLRQDALRTPASRFAGLPEPPGVAHFVSDLPALNGLRLHFVEVPAAESDPVTLCLHDSRSWSAIWYQHLSAAMAQRARTLAVDLIGFGHSDKPKREAVHTLQWHTDVLLQWLDRLNLHKVVLLVPSGCDAATVALSQSLVQGSAARIVRCDFVDVSPLDAQVLNAPYPDQGYRAGLRAFATMTASSRLRWTDNSRQNR